MINANPASQVHVHYFVLIRVLSPEWPPELRDLYWVWPHQVACINMAMISLVLVRIASGNLGAKSKGVKDHNPGQAMLP